MGDGVGIVGIARVVAGKEGIQAAHPVWPDPDRLQTDRGTIVRERELDVWPPGLTAEVARRIDPHGLEGRERPAPLLDRPRLAREEMREPEHHPQTQILGNTPSP